MSIIPSHTKSALGAVVIVCASGFSPAAHAAHGLYASAAVCFTGGTFPQSCIQSGPISDTVGPVGTEANVQNVQRANVIQDYGVFHGSAEASMTNQATGGSDGLGVRASVQGQAGDTWVIGGGTGLAYLSLGYTITGKTITSSSGPGWSSEAYLLGTVRSVAHDGNGGEVDGNLSTGVITGSKYVDLGSLPFYFNQPLDLGFTTLVFAGTGFDKTFIGQTYSGMASAGFADTVTLTSIKAYDAQGTLIPGITIAAESGTQYPLTAPVTSPVPEPSIATLASIGGLVLLYRRKRSRQTA